MRVFFACMQLMQAACHAGRACQEMLRAYEQQHKQPDGPLAAAGSDSLDAAGANLASWELGAASGVSAGSITSYAASLLADVDQVARELQQLVRQRVTQKTLWCSQVQHRQVVYGLL